MEGSVLYRILGALLFVQTRVGAEINSEMEEAIIEPYVYREPGCPLVIERSGFNITKVEGAWSLSYGSIHWLADLSSASFETTRYPKVSEIRSMCTSATVKGHNATASSNMTMEILFKTRDQKRDAMSLRCWPQRPNTKSKFECYFSTANIHTYLMVAATDHESWILLIRCEIGVSQPGEGMSWAVLSKGKKLDPDTATVIFGLLEGYGFDLPSYKFENCYDTC